MRPTHTICFGFGLLLSTGLWTTAATAQVHIEDVRVGFGYPTAGNEGNYKIGDWTPVRVRLRAEKDGFSGALELSTTDSDDVEAAFLRRVSVAPNETIDVTSFAKPGKQMPEFHVRLIDESGKLRDRAIYDTSSGRAWDGAMQSTTLIVAVGRPAGLDAEQFAKRPGYPRENFRIAHLESTRELPARWYGYDAVDQLILCLDKPDQLEGMDVTARSAVESWVRHGGHLVVSVGTSWERVLADTVLGPMLPVEIDRTETVKQLSELESYVSQSAPAVRIKDPLSVPHLTKLRGKIEVGTRDLPLVVRAPYGFGTVTFVALELNHEPFSSWDGRTDFWLKLLAIRKQPQQDSNPQAAWGQRALSDISSHLRMQLEHFEGVSLVPFQWVAFFIFLYILLIGPVDYFLVKKVFKRMELTWVTFPTMVLGVSLAAYFTAYWLKGDELRINKIDVVDVDQVSGSLRGTSWFTLFSPQIKNYTVKIEPELAVSPQPPGQQGGPPVAVSWLGLAEDAIGGMGRQGGAGLFRRGYRFGPDAQTLEDVPVQVWSMKGFSARWHGTAVATVDAKLESVDINRVRGTVTNRLGIPLEDCSLVFGRIAKVYPLGNLPIDGSAVVGKRTTEDLKGHLTRRAAPFAGTQARNVQAYNQSSQFNPNDLVFTMMFHDRLPEGNQFAANDYFNDLDLSEQLEHQRAILVGRVTSKGSKLILNESEVNENIQRSCFLRVILPVVKGAPEEPFEPPGL